VSDFTMSRTLEAPYDATVADVRNRLVEQGFGVLTEIDVRATLKTKLDVDVPSQVILGACRPELAHQALTAVPSIAALLPCNVVVRALDETHTIVEAVDPDAMLSMVDDDTLRAVARDARGRITAALAALTGEA
jgi:uncharacterized protein (DUF302 family)